MIELRQYSIPLTYLRGSRFITRKGDENDYTHAPRPLHSFGYIKRGSACFVCGEERIRLGAGDVVFVPKGCRYHSYWLGEEGTEVYSCHFDLVPFGEPIGTRVYPLQKIAHCEAFFETFEGLSKEGEDEKDGLLALGSFFELLAHLFARMRYEATLSINERILRAVRYIESRYDEPLRVSDLAALCHLSTSYFYECFKREMGVSPVEYKNRIMIRHAERSLIDSPDVSIEVLSEKLGFESSIYFRRLFKAKTGMTPREYRKRADREI
ncbi:MAG: AraC family transcriptional regulator [Ruminococcaceae bacterium]|nr:AraC family transcriptional regulator [Oscillospiraceae bacterium]